MKKLCILLLLVFMFMSFVKINSYCYEICVSSYEDLTDFYNDVEFSCRVSDDVDWYDTAYIAPNVGDNTATVNAKATLQNNKIETTFTTENGYEKYVYVCARLEDGELKIDEKTGIAANLSVSESWLTLFNSDVVSGVHEATVLYEDETHDAFVALSCEGQHFFARMP